MRIPKTAWLILADSTASNAKYRSPSLLVHSSFNFRSRSQRLTLPRGLQKNRDMPRYFLVGNLRQPARLLSAPPLPSRDCSLGRRPTRGYSSTYLKKSLAYLTKPYQDLLRQVNYKPWHNLNLPKGASTQYIL